MNKPSTSLPSKIRQGGRQSTTARNKRSLKKKLPQKQELPQVTGMEATELGQTTIEGIDERIADSIESLPELERAIGIADGIDSQTGESTDVQSTPHLEAE